MRYFKQVIVFLTLLFGATPLFAQTNRSSVIVNGSAAEEEEADECDGDDPEDCEDLDDETAEATIPPTKRAGRNYSYLVMGNVAFHYTVGGMRCYIDSACLALEYNASVFNYNALTFKHRSFAFSSSLYIDLGLAYASESVEGDSLVDAQYRRGDYCGGEEDNYCEYRYSNGGNITSLNGVFSVGNQWEDPDSGFYSGVDWVTVSAPMTVISRPTILNSSDYMQEELSAERNRIQHATGASSFRFLGINFGYRF